MIIPPHLSPFSVSLSPSVFQWKNHSHLHYHHHQHHHSNQIFESFLIFGSFNSKKINLEYEKQETTSTWGDYDHAILSIHLIICQYNGNNGLMCKKKCFDDIYFVLEHTRTERQ